MHTIGLRSDHAPDEIPASHRDLAQCPPVAALTTVTRDGYPQTLVEAGEQVGAVGRAWLGWIERLDWHSFPVSLCESR